MMIYIEKKGIIKEEEVKKSFFILIEFVNHIAKLKWSNVKRSVYIILTILFFAILMSLDQKTFLNPFWMVMLVFCMLILLQIFVLMQRKKAQKLLYEREMEMCRNFINNNYKLTITEDYIINQFGDLETKYPISLLKTCYSYKRNFILHYEKHFNQFLLLSFDSFNDQEIQDLYSFFKEKELLDEKYDISKVKEKTIDLTNELHQSH